MDYIVQQLEPFVGQEELDNLKKVIERKWITEGPFSQEFLQLIKEFTGAKHALLAPNGTLALYLALLGAGVKRDDEVIVPDFTFIASGMSVQFIGAKPVFVDVEFETGNIDITKIEAAITPMTKAIMPVHLFGQSARMDEVMQIAKRHNLKVIEDAAQGYGVFYKNKHVGTIGDVSVISFFADKTVTAGEGAVILTNSDEIFDNIRYLRNQGRLNSGTFIHDREGMNFRMTDLQCAVGVAQLKKFKLIEELKLKNYELYKKELASVKEVQFMEESEFSNFVPFRANIRVPNAEELMNYLEKNKIQTRGFFYPLHKQPPFSYLNNKDEAFPNSIHLSQTGMALPVFCNLKEEQILYVCKTIKDFFKR
jgi:perosamine synthetase